MRWISPDPRPHQTDLAMIGAKPGQQVLVFGAGDGSLAAAVAGVTGLNGRTVVVDPDASAGARVEAAAGNEGVLVEYEQEPWVPLSAASDTFDIAVLLQALSAAPDRAALVRAAARVIRPGGRIIVIEGTRITGWRALVQRPAPSPVTGEAAKTLLADAGLRAARVLSDTGGVMYAEAAKPR